MKSMIIIFFIFSVNFIYADLTDGLVAHYPFNGNANDESGNGNHGTVYGATLTTDRFGNENSAYEFDGIGDYINVNNTSLSIRGNISICFWARNLDFAFADSQPNYIVSKGWYWSEPWQDYGFGLNTNIKYYFKISINNIGYVVRTGQVLDNNFHFLTGIYDYDNFILKIYLDGEFVEGVLIENVTDMIDNTNSEFIIGDWNSDSEWHFFNGTIDDIRIYDRVLSESEIEELYHFDGWMNAPEDIIIIINDNTAELTWDFVEGAGSYKVYSDTDPYGDFTTEEWTGTNTSWSEAVSENKKFYVVEASTETVRDNIRFLSKPSEVISNKVIAPRKRLLNPKRKAIRR